MFMCTVSDWPPHDLHESVLSSVNPAVPGPLVIKVEVCVVVVVVP